MRMSDWSSDVCSSDLAAPDEKFGETPAAIITAAEGLDEATVVAKASEQPAGYKVPRYVVLRKDPLPRLPNGKISKTAIPAESKDLTTTHARPDERQGGKACVRPWSTRWAPNEK